jgi:hypothetical protein
MGTMTMHIAPDGSDANDGLRPETLEAGRGPLASLRGAFNLLREYRRQGAISDARILMRGGTYRMEAPLTLSPQDSLPVAIMPFEDEQPVISGGRVVAGWTETTHNGRRAWRATIPEVAAGRWYFRSLYVNDERRERPRLPKQGMTRLAEVPGMPLPNGFSGPGYDRFTLAPGMMKPYRNLTDIEVIAFHFWMCERMPVAAFDPETELITTTVKSKVPLVEAWGDTLAPCYLDNVYEALTEPGEWYLSREDGELTYLPLDGETPANTTVVAPVALQLLKLKGNPDRGEWVEWVTFKDIAFRHTDWAMPHEERVEKDTAWHDPDRSVYHYGRTGTGSAGQGDADISGVIFLRGARNCTFEGCTVANVGWYGVEIGDGCRAIALRGCELADLGAGGVKLNGADYNERRPVAETGNNRITDCHVHHGGRVYCAAIGILSMHSFGNRFLHNDIHDFYYTGISLGWQWHFGPSVSTDNKVEFNHIHRLGFGRLSDMGGVYTLGNQSGAVIRNNHIHDIQALNYGAWCIYPDEGTSHLLIENNVCHSTNREIFHQHYGRENIVRNNVFAFAERGLVCYSSFVRPDMGFRLYGNILLSRGEPHYLAGYDMQVETLGHESNFNLLYRYDGQSPRFAKKTKTSAMASDGIDFAEWQRLGHDRQSFVADPRCVDPEHADFTLAPDSPAIDRLGFQPIDLSKVGPRRRERWADCELPHPRAIPGMK